MHTFQPYPIDKMEFNPFTKIGKEWALVSAGDKTRCNTMTVSSTLTLLSKKIINMVQYPSGHKGAVLKTVVSVKIRFVGSSPTCTAMAK